MSDRTPASPTSSPYQTWLHTFPPDERLLVDRQAEILAFQVHHILYTVREIHPAIGLGIWLHALHQVWQMLEEELRALPKEATPHE